MIAASRCFTCIPNSDWLLMLVMIGVVAVIVATFGKQLSDRVVGAIIAVIGGVVLVALWSKQRGADPLSVDLGPIIVSSIFVLIGLFLVIRGGPDDEPSNVLRALTRWFR
jgi:hypothetical protein